MRFRSLLQKSLAVAFCSAQLLGLWSTSAQASFLSGEALDTAADVVSWIVLIFVPILLIGLFWFVHVLPEKIAESRGHPQAHAIKVLCFLSLAFGGMLWPLAWLWAFSKPVLYKMAYGIDRLDHYEPEQVTYAGAPEIPVESEIAIKPASEPNVTAEALRRVH